MRDWQGQLRAGPRRRGKEWVLVLSPGKAIRSLRKDQMSFPGSGTL